MLVEPSPLAVLRSADAVELSFDLSPALEYLPDHFPRYPMLPGVVQLGWAVRAAQRELQAPAVLRRVVNLKFMAPIRPGAALVLRVERLRADEFAFSYRRDGTVLSGGRLLFVAD